VKELIIYRHAKALSARGREKDSERQLKEEGKETAVRNGIKLKDIGLVPDCVYSSSAVRAAETAQLTCDKAGFTGTIEFREDLYDATEQEILELVRDQPDTVARLMVVGHNPVLEEVVCLITGERVHMKPGTLVLVQLPDASWASAVDGEARGLVMQQIREAGKTQP
jgi:phosphohistidine phosphatase